MNIKEMKFLQGYNKVENALCLKEVPAVISLMLYLRFNARQIVLACERPVCPSEVLMFRVRETAACVKSSTVFFWKEVGVIY